MYYMLVAMSGPLEGQAYHVVSPFEIGRSGDLAVQLIAPAVSRRHAELRFVDDGVLLVDLDSRNGTFLRGERISSHPLRHGDTFEIGASSFRFEEREGEPPEEDDDELGLKLLSGPVERVTEIFDKHSLEPAHPHRPTTVPEVVVNEAACSDPLHAVARAKGWRFCPACGEAPHPNDELPPVTRSDG